MVLCSSEVCEKTVLDVLRACGVLQHLHCEDGARDRPIQPIVEDAESREQRECRECLWYGPTKPILTERPAAQNARPTPCSRAAARHSAEGCGGFGTHRAESFVSVESSAGMDPVSRLPPRYANWSSARTENDRGIVPVRSFRGRDSHVIRDAHERPAKTSGIEPTRVDGG